MNGFRSIIKGIGAGACAAFILILFGCNKLERTGFNPGDLPPQIELQTLAGRPFKLRELKGKVVLLNFWATWCEPCVAELPSLERLYTKYRARGFEVVGIGVDDEASDLDSFRRRFGLSFDIPIDAESAVKRSYGLTGVPETFLLDRDGTLQLVIVPGDTNAVTRIMGPVDWDDAGIQQQIAKLLG